MENFIKSDIFIGKKEGYEYKLGKFGLGYYITIDIKRVQNDLIIKIFSYLKGESVKVSRNNMGFIIFSFYDNKYSISISTNEEWKEIEYKLNIALSKKNLYSGDITSDKINKEIVKIIN
tara:strand:+ start:196 stop:552 length:357 start_codon:yes stop_codon:yes gene_type:complete